LTKDVVTDALNISFGSVDDLQFQDADVIIAHRISLHRIQDVERVKTYCRENGAKFVYDIDDDLLALESDHTQSEVYESFKPVVRHALATADQVWVSTPILAERYRLPTRDVTIIPNELDPRVWNPADATREQNHTIRFLYMGTPTHRSDFSELVLPAFARLRNEFHDQVSLTLIGITDQAHADTEYSILEVPPHVALSYPAFASWLQSLTPYDVGLAPLLDTPFNRAKSNIKQLEYSALGLPTIASDLPPYRDVPCLTKATLLVEPTPQAFYVAMRSLVVDAGRRCELQSAARDIARANVNASKRQEPRVPAIQKLVESSERSLAAGSVESPRDGVGSPQSISAVGGLPHVDLTRMQNLAQSLGLFDPAWYQNTYPDVAATKTDPFEHYLRYGGAKRYNPSSQFDVAAYLAYYPDVSDAGINPLIHYVTYGLAEGRTIHPVTVRTDEFIPPVYPSPILPKALCVAFYVGAHCAAAEDGGSAAQAHIEERELAKSFGIGGFCYYTDGVGAGGARENVLSDILSVEDDFRFCVCWTAPYDSGALLAEPLPNSPGCEPAWRALGESFSNQIGPLLQRPNYLRIDGRAVVLVYRAAFISCVAEMTCLWRDYARKEGMGELLLVSTHASQLYPASIGFDAAVEGAPDQDGRTNLDYIHHLAESRVDYRDLVKRSYLRKNSSFPLFRTVCTGPESAALSDAVGFHHFSPAAYQEWLENACRAACEPSETPGRVVFLNAWNGPPSAMSLQPSPSYGYGYLNATAKALQTVGTPECVPNIAVIAHVFYEDVWPEIVARLRRWKISFQLCVSVPEERGEKIAKLIRSDFPEARITTVPNRGRDIAPFLQQAKLVIADGIELICKIHTKKSSHRTDGAGWRSDLYEMLLGDEGYPEKIAAAFVGNAALGIVAPEGHVIPAEYYWGANADRVHDLMGQMGYSGSPNPLMFAAGSMFWIRSQALEPILRLSLRHEDFEEEEGQVDGTLAHAIERLFPLAARMRGYRMVDTRVLNAIPGSADHLRSDAELGHLRKRERHYRYAPASG
jgi:glycosyltransferase involved in cell wall biosynthesis